MTTLGVNVGDEFIREGICSFLDEIIPNWRPFYVNKHDLSTLYRRVGDEDDYLADKFVDADIIVQAGAPVYWKIGDSTSYNVEWAEELWRKRIFSLGPQKPILNIAAGACQPYPDTARTFLSDPQCVEFAKKAAAACAWTSVRDPLASQILYALDIQHDVIPCSAFHAARRMEYSLTPDNVIGVNLMSYGGHFRLRDDVDNDVWMKEISTFLPQLRQYHPLMFIAHDQQEKEFMEQFRMPGESVFLSPDYREYMQVYSRCRLVVANRVHGGVCAAGFGRPAIIIGNDTRLLIGDYIGIPSCYVGSVRGEEIVTLAEESIRNGKQEEERLITLREESAARYRQAICEALSIDLPNSRPASRGTSLWKAEKKQISLGSEAESSTPPFRDFMTTMNCFARRCGLREFTDQPQEWAYPWLWFNGLRALSWESMAVLDLCSEEISPMPWFLASLGAHVTLAGTDPQLVPILEELVLRTGLKIEWLTNGGEKLPFPDDSFDVITSLSFAEYQRGMPGAMDELARVLKPGGLFALSFDCCEPGSGLSTREPAGRAFTMKEFEEVVWSHQAFNRGGKPPAWNAEGLSAYSQRQQQSASHLDLAVGAGFLRKKMLDEKCVRKILIPRFDTFGDIVLLEGFVEELRKSFPSSEIVMLVRKNYDQLAELFPLELDLRWLSVGHNPYDAPTAEDREEFESFLEGLPKEDLDLIVFTAFNRTWLDDSVALKFHDVLKLAIAPTPLISGWPLNRLVVVRVDENKLETEKYQLLLDILSGGDKILSPPRLVVRSEGQTLASEILEAIGLADVPYVACVPAGTQNQAIKIWPLERFADLIAWVVESYRYQPLLVGHESERDQIVSLAGLLEGRGVKARIWLGKSGEIPLLAALLGRTALYLGNDTGPLHISNALGVPVVGIYGGGTFPRFLPSGNNSVGVVGDLPCFGCYWQCLFGDAPCMSLVSVDDVKEAAKLILSGAPPVRNILRAAHVVSPETADFIGKAVQEAYRRREAFAAKLGHCELIVRACQHTPETKTVPEDKFQQDVLVLRNSFFKKLVVTLSQLVKYMRLRG
jgi:ADP-heptose:LPS heptosyltransferase